MMNDITAVILAAGRSRRMQSKKSKLLFRLHGKPVICHVTGACLKSGIKNIILVIGANAPEIKKAAGPRFKYALQENPAGTGHALIQARNQLLMDYPGDILVMPGDAPFITDTIIKALIRQHRRHHASATLLTTIFDNPPPYGRVLRNRRGNINRIVEEKDATPKEKTVKEVATSHYCFRAPAVLPLLDKISNHNTQREYYLTDIVGILAKSGKKVRALPIKDSMALFGINTKMDLQQAKKTI